VSEVGTLCPGTGFEILFERAVHQGRQLLLLDNAFLKGQAGRLQTSAPELCLRGREKAIVVKVVSWVDTLAEVLA